MNRSYGRLSYKKKLTMADHLPQRRWKQMDLWQLKVFVNVVDEKSFSRAGDAIFISQPTVSSHIKELEAHFGCRLIDRMGRGAVPTKAGDILYLHAKQLLNLKDRTEAAMSAFLGDACGDVVFGGSTIPATYIIPAIIGEFNQRYPSINISIVSGDTSEICNAILDGRLEAGLVGASVDEPNMNQERLIKDEMKLVVPPTHPWALAR
ncbi:MAG: LysR family transcriptional regulator, partial [Desulfamplus sp.]|nr:LysR family transcriptional regulator [Desulfamplus sp.]